MKTRPLSVYFSSSGHSMRSRSSIKIQFRSMSLSALSSHSFSHGQCNALSRISKVQKHSTSHSRSCSPRPNSTSFSRQRHCEVSPGARAMIRDALIRHMGFGILPTVTTTAKAKAKKSQRQRQSLRQRPRGKIFQADLHRTADCPWVSTFDYLNLDREDLVNLFLRYHDDSIVANDSPFFADYVLEGTRFDQVRHLRACFLGAHTKSCEDLDDKGAGSSKFGLPDIPDEEQLLRLLDEEDPDLEEPEEDPDVELSDSPPLDEYDYQSALDQLLASVDGTSDLASARPVFHFGGPWGRALPSIEQQQGDQLTQNEVKKNLRRNEETNRGKPKMVVCRFFQQGNCRFGDRCRNEHPRDGGSSGGSSNPFGAISNSNQRGNQSAGDLLGKYKIDLDVVQKDLTTEHPQWILSAYGPGRDTPEQLFGGSQREQSFEEMRLHYYAGKASGTEQQALAQAQELWQNAQQQMQTAAQNLSQAGSFITEAENKHPNRHDVCREGTQGAPFGQFLVGRTSNTASSNPFGAPSTTTASSNPFGAPSQSNASPFGAPSSNTSGSAFGQPSTLGANSNPFGAPAQANQTQGSAFGQPSQMGSTGGSAFGQPSQMGQQTSAFGQPSTMGATSNPFGAPAQANQTQGSAFGQPSQMGSTSGSAFGQPSQMGSTGGGVFGQASQTNTSGSAFGQPSQMGNTGGSAFGQPSTMGSGGSAFGQPSQMGATQGSAFGQASQMGQNSSPFGSNTASAATANPFGSSASTTTNASPFATAGNNAPAAAASNPFGQPSQPAAPAAANPFATTSNNPSSAASNPFASKPAQSSPFGQPSTQQSNASPFGQPAQPSQTTSAFGQPSQAANPFGAASAAPAGTNAELKNPYPEGSSKQHPKDYIKKDANGTTVSFKGQAVMLEEADKYVVRGMGGKTTRVWFPDGPPAYSAETEMPREMYDQKTISQWQAFEQSGNFDDGLMPELPPPRECTVWDF